MFEPAGFSRRMPGAAGELEAEGAVRACEGERGRRKTSWFLPSVRAEQETRMRTRREGWEMGGC